jgi:hypothetical protein
MNKESSKKISKKEAQELIYNKIAGALEEYKKDIKPKKLESKLKKVSKSLAGDIAKASGDHNGTVKRKSKKAHAPKVKARSGQTKKKLEPEIK